MLLPLTPTRHAAWCDRCLRGSEVITFDAPAVARFFAIERLRGAGWVHVAPAGPGRDDSERQWSAETYCPECSYQRAEAREGERKTLLNPRASAR